jgi:PhzF family phenazine biosynthesis protein
MSSTAGIPLFQVDAFTNRPFAGNPAAVCLLLDRERDDAWMQAVAAEMNLAETAFVQTLADGFSLRWFTPTVEVDLCGHATLAAAHVLWEEGRVRLNEPVRFHTRSGWLTCTRQGDRIDMDFPAESASACNAPAELIRGLGCKPLWVGRNRMDYLVQLASEPDLVALKPDFRLLAQVPTRGVIVTATATRTDADFISRFFAPQSGIDEDPVTGSAHCCLGPFWGERLQKRELVGCQASQRGGFVSVTLNGERVLLGGQAVTVLRGELMSP